MFDDRTHAGKLLARALLAKHYPDPVVFALPRGGVPVAFEVAIALKAPLDLVLAHKIGLPWQPELAVGAVVDGAEAETFVDEEMVKYLKLPREAIEAAARRELEEIERRRALFFGGRPHEPVRGRTGILVDDGLATGQTALAAGRVLRRRGPAKLVLAVPVAPTETLAKFDSVVDEIVCLEQPDPFMAVGAHFRDFTQVSDEEVVRLLEAVRHGARQPREG